MATTAVDGPRGPRGTVNKGAAIATLKTGAAIIPTVVIPSRRWILPKTWDRTQIPKPFADIQAIFGEAIYSSESDPVEEIQKKLSEVGATVEIK